MNESVELLCAYERLGQRIIARFQVRGPQHGYTAGSLEMNKADWQALLPRIRELCSHITHRPERAPILDEKWMQPRRNRTREDRRAAPIIEIA